METRTFRLDKLVRDGIPGENERVGGRLEYRVLEGPEKVSRLIDKVIEEAVEFGRVNPEDTEKRTKELGQIFGVVRAIAKEMGIPMEEIVELEDTKQSELGAYDQGIFVETVTLPAHNEWANYYASQPDRFPELHHVQ